MFGVYIHGNVLTEYHGQWMITVNIVLPSLTIVYGPKSQVGNSCTDCLIQPVSHPDHTPLFSCKQSHNFSTLTPVTCSVVSPQKQTLGQGSVRSLYMCEHQNPSSNLQHPCKSQAWHQMSAASTSWSRDERILRVHWPASPNSELQIQPKGKVKHLKMHREV